MRFGHGKRRAALRGYDAGKLPSAEQSVSRPLTPEEGQVVDPAHGYAPRSAASCNRSWRAQRDRVRPRTPRNPCPCCAPKPRHSSKWSWKPPPNTHLAAGNTPHWPGGRPRPRGGRKLRPEPPACANGRPGRTSTGAASCRRSPDHADRQRVFEREMLRVFRENGTEHA